MMKKFMGMLLACTLTLAVGCTNAESTEGGDQTSAKLTETQKTTEREVTAEDEGAAAVGITWEDMADVRMVYASLGAIPSGIDAVEAAINDITEKEINTHVSLQIIEMGNYAQQVSLMMSSQEQIDLLMFPYGSASFAAMQAQGQYMDITELLDTYAKPTLELLGDLTKGTTIGGRIYGLSGYRNLAGGAYIVMRTDVLEDLGLVDAAKNMKSLKDYETILKSVRESEEWGHLIGMVSTGNGVSLLHTCLFDIDKDFMTAPSYDTLGASYKIVSVVPSDEGPQVRLTYEMDEYQRIYEQMKDWYDKGYVHKDAATTPDAGTDFVRQGAAFSYICSGEYGVEQSHSKSCEMPMTCVQIAQFPLVTSQCQQFGWGVPSTSAYPEAAVAFLNMMYTDSRIANLLAWGIEGVDYEVVDGEACYIAGNEMPAYHTNDFLYGNQFLVWPWQGAGAESRKEALAIMENAQHSEYMGFACDTSSVTDELAAVSNCLNEYQKLVEMGMATEEQFEEFLEKLHICGADKIISCYQTQLDQWLGENK